MTRHNSGGTRLRIELPSERTLDWMEFLTDALLREQPGPVELFAATWRLRCGDLKAMEQLLQRSGFSLVLLQTQNDHTAVSAQALGLPVQILTAPPQGNPKTTQASAQSTTGLPAIDPAESLRLHRGTLRSGDQLQTSGDLLILGDVNPGARVIAGGDVMVWGRLRGIAHAGSDGNRTARIVALQLRPLQLRIADLVARGPEDLPQPGLAEEAHVDDEVIVIEPAEPRLLPRILNGN